MQSSQDQVSQSWSDPRFLLSPTIPLFFIFVGGLLIFFSLYRVKNLGASEITISVASFLGGLYLSYCAYQLMFIELRKKFIAHHVRYDNGVFILRGYYFKEARFTETEIKKVENYLISERFFSESMGTFLSRNNRFTIPNGKNINLKISLRDGRVFYLPGEMGRPGQWKNEDVKELRDFMESCVGSVN
jgi:hypothetical protein